MPELILIAGTTLAAAIGIALAGLILRQAVRNACPRVPRDRPAAVAGEVRWGSLVRELGVRGYDHPELAREDFSTRARISAARTDI
jgi:hypothetical protein